MPTKINLINETRFAIVDDADADLILQFKWCISISARKINGGHNFYCTTYVSKEKAMQFPQFSYAEGKAISMHKFLLGKLPEGYCYDHINGNGLDNRRENLRVVLRAQNNMNRRVNINSTSGFKGVRKNAYGKFIAVISFQKKVHYIGSFDDPLSAAKAYDKKAREFFGEFAKLNIETFRQQ